MLARLMQGVVGAPAVYGGAYAEREVAFSDAYRQADLEPIEAFKAFDCADNGGADIFEGFDCDGYSNYDKRFLAMWPAGRRQAHGGGVNRPHQ